MRFQPVIKWSGSKRSQMNDIIGFFPKEIDTYYEPFCGGASMLRCLLESGIRCRRYVASDKNSHLIDLWNAIKSSPDILIEDYRRMWMELNKDNDLERKKSYFSLIREIFNTSPNPSLFLFIMRTTTNGMPRYNGKGEFNNSLHVTRNGIRPDALLRVMQDWHQVLCQNDVQFVCCDYREIQPSKEDFVYLDPPYANTRGMYFGGIDLDCLWNTLSSFECPWVLSFDGKSGETDNTYNVPPIYDEHHYIRSGNSSFKRVIGNSRNSIVYESIYIKR